MKPQLLQILDQIPEGKVISYGQLAEQLDIQFDIQTSGWMAGKVLSGFTQEDWHHPWQRVITKDGYISALKLGERGLTQLAILRAEGIEVKDGFVDMKKFGWKFER